MLRLPVLHKKAFKEFASCRVKDYFSDKLKAKICVIKTQIHPDDFDFQRKQLSPIIGAAHSKREIIAMKITILHLLGEYKCGENMFRIKVRKSLACEYCEDDLDCSEHAIMTCRPVQEFAAVRQQLKLVLEAIAEEKMIPERELWITLKLDFKLISRLILNPTSQGNAIKYRVTHRSKSVLKIVWLCQEFVLHCHNVRKQSSRVRNESSQKTFRFKTEQSQKRTLCYLGYKK